MNTICSLRLILPIVSMITMSSVKLDSPSKLYSIEWNMDTQNPFCIFPELHFIRYYSYSEAYGYSIGIWPFTAISF